MTVVTAPQPHRGAVVVRAGKFGLVGLIGLGVNLAAQAALTEFAQWNYLVAAVAATQMSSTFNFALAESWVFEAVGDSAARARRYLSFLLMNNVALILRAPMMWALVDGFGVHYSIANFLSLALLTLVRFGLSDHVIWGHGGDLPADRRRRPGAATVWSSPSRYVVDEAMHPVVRFIVNAKTALRPRSRRWAESQRDQWTNRSPPQPGDASPDAIEDSDPPPGDGANRPEPPSSDLVPAEPEPDPDPPDESEFSSRAQAFALTLVLLVGAGLRLWKLMAVGFNSDEAVYSSQAAAIAGDRSIAEFFPVFRAHPFLFQAVLSVPYQLGTSDVVGRLLSVAFGLATVVVVFATARSIYGARVGLVAAGLVSLMPYHVVVTRQVLLDGPMTFFATLSLYFVAKFVLRRQLVWLLAASCTLAMTVLAKETYIILVGSVFMFFALSPEIRLRLREMMLAGLVFVAVLLPFPVTILLAGKSETGKNYLSWQLFRRPNHGLGFYATVLPQYVGYAVLAGAVVAFALTWGRRRTWRERLLISWVVVPVAFLEIWPVKGYHYLLAASIPIAILAAQGLCLSLDRLANGLRRWRTRPEFSSGRSPVTIVGTLMTVVVAGSLMIPSWAAVQPATDEAFLAGTGGVPGGREVGEWIGEHVPEGAEFLTVGPSMANLVQYYGRRKAYGLSVSSNPLNRNPSYEPIANPDLAIRTSDLQYLIWDSYSSMRSSFFGDKLLSYAERYHGRVVYSYEPEGRPLITVYEVRP